MAELPLNPAARNFAAAMHRLPSIAAITARVARRLPSVPCRCGFSALRCPTWAARPPSADSPAADVVASESMRLHHLIPQVMSRIRRPSARRMRRGDLGGLHVLGADAEPDQS